MKPLSERTLKMLEASGWSSSRDEQSIEDGFRRALGSEWLPSASLFVRKFGGLSLANALWTLKEPASGHMLLDLKSRVEHTIGSKVVAVAASNYMGDGSILWIDATGRFYVVDSEGMLFVGDDEAAVFEVLIFGEKPPDPPDELRDRLAEAYDWNTQQPSSNLQ